MRQGASSVLELARKDLKDLRRDIRTLAAIILLPFIGLPGLALVTGLLQSAQQVIICVNVEDSSQVALEVTGRILNGTVDILRGWGMEPTVVWGGGGSCDISITIPEGFSNNLTSLDRPATIVVSSGLTGAGMQALAALQESARHVSEDIARDRVGRLANMANVSVSPENVLNPLTVKVQYHTAAGAPASPEMAGVAETARVFAFSLFFVVNPVIIYMSDAVAGERERRTLEMLLISPISKGEFIAGKVLAAGVAGLIGALADSTGLLSFFLLSGFTLKVTMGLVAVWIASSVGLILFSAFLIALIASRSGSIRSAQNLSFLVTTLAMVIYFASLVVDFNRLPRSVETALALVPFTHGALALEYYSVGLLKEAVEFIGALYLSGMIMGILSVRFFDVEKALR